MKKDLVFEKVYGYQEVKEELNRIKDWYENKEFLNNPKITLPKGILLHGSPGCGKTLFAREFINNFDCPKFIIEGKNDNTASEIKKVFDKAKQEEFAIVVIDELELLVPEESKEQRVLQQELDGIDQKGSILVVATTNRITRIGSPLKRPGRFDKKIEIDVPNRECRAEIFKHMLLDLGIDISKINLEHVSKHCASVTGATIKAICNDVYLRCQQSPITEEEIELSYERVDKGHIGKKPQEFNNYQIAIHEAGHSLMAIHFKENWALYKATFTDRGGNCEIEEVTERYMTLEKRIQNIMIGFGGFVAEELVFGYHEFGSYSDVEKVHDYCRRLIERSAIYGIKYHVTQADDAVDSWHLETPALRKTIEKKTYALMKKYEKKVRKYLKAHLSELKAFADLMCKQGYVSYRDVNRVVAQSQTSMELVLLGFSKKKPYDKECIVEFTPRYEPMLISCEMKYDPKIMVPKTIYDADVKYWSFCWWTDKENTGHPIGISEHCFPLSFISTTIEEIIEQRFDVARPYIRYKAKIHGHIHECKLCYPKQYEDDEPIKDTFEVGDKVVGLFKAKVRIRKRQKRD